ncbi:hypothetical protein V8F20_009121 [Naviculisporaceae sp. PSN 640]
MAESVKITLSLDDLESQSMPFPRRVLVLDQENKSIMIGRASKLETKGLVSSPNNAWFLSPVMSRQHAELVANLEDKVVTIKDLGSLHGTYINGEKDKLKPHSARELQDGDRLKLGLSIPRGDETFPPTIFDVNIEYREKKTDTPTATFQVPDCSDVEDDYSSDSNSDVQELTELEPRTPTLSIPKVVGSTAFDVIDLTQLPTSDTYHPAIIDLSSPPHSPLSTGDICIAESVVELSDTGSPPPDQSASPDHSRLASPDILATSLNVSVTSPEIRARNEISRPLSDPFEACNDNDSSSGYESSCHASIVDNTDDEMDDNTFPFSEGESSVDDEEASESDLLLGEANLSSPYYIDSDDESLPHGHSEEDEESEDLHDDFDDFSSEDEASDPEDGFPDEEFQRLMESISQTVKAKDTGVADMRMGPSDSRSKGVVAINELLNAEKSPVPLQPAAIFTARAPSPSDAVMPKSCYTPQVEKPTNGPTQPLAERTGKVEYFAAREQNKILAAKLQRAPELRSSVHSLCNSASPGGGPFTLDTTPSMGQFLESVEDHEPELPELPQVKLAEPVPEPTTSQEAAQSLLKDAATNRATNEQPSRRTHVGILDIVDTCQPAPTKTTEPKQEAAGVRGKRKADDISVTDAAEEEWAQRGSLENEKVVAPLSTQMPPSGQGATASSSAPSLAVFQEAHVRPTKKLRLFAEKLGYAALGGVTAGAMIFGTLVYTAPTFV